MSAKFAKGCKGLIIISGRLPGVRIMLINNNNFYVRQALKKAQQTERHAIIYTEGVFLQQTGNTIIFVLTFLYKTTMHNCLALNTFGRSYLFFFFTACSS